MQINRFDGGINTRLAPHLLKASEAVASVNIDPISGVLKPFQQAQAQNANLGKSFIWFNNLWVGRDTRTSFATYNKVLFSADGVNPPEYTIDGAQWNSLHIPAPSEPLKVAPLTLNTLTEIQQVTTPFEWNDGSLPERDNQIGFGVQEGHDELFHGFNVNWNFRRRYKIKIQHPKAPIYTTLSGENFFKFYINHLSNSNSAHWYEYIITYLRYSPQYPLDRIKMFFANWDDTSGKYVKAYTANWRPLTDGRAICIAANAVAPEVFYEKETREFPSGTTLNYVLRWKGNTEAESKVEQASLTLNYQNALCYGTRIKMHDGYTLEAFRNGKKCILAEYDGWYYDNQVSSETLIESKVSYLYTYYVSKLGIETPPSKVAEVVAAGNSLKFQINWELPTDPQIDQVRIYRFGGGISAPSLVGTYPIALRTITDSLNSPIDGRILTTQTNIPAPEKLAGISVIYAMLWGFQGNTLYYSQIGNPFAWSAYNSIIMEGEITGFGAVPNGILIFLKTQTYLLTGQTPQNFTKFLLSTTIGCISRVSIQQFQNGLIWLGENGLYISNGGNVADITQAKYTNFTLSRPFASLVWNNFYILATADNMLMVDLKNLRIFYLSDKAVYLAYKGAKLYHLDSNGDLYETFGGEHPRELVFHSATYAEGSLTNRKNYSTIYFHSTGDLQVKVFLDNILAGESVLQKGVTELKLSSQHTRGYGIRFEIVGSGTLNEIEYKAEGRQNGR